MTNEDLNVKQVSIAKLRPHPKNSKLHPKDQVEKIAMSIRNYGFNNPVLIDSDYTILAGHGRYQAAKVLQLKTVPVIILDHLSPEKARAYLIADNKTQESGYNVEILTDELFDLSTLGIDPIDLGFDETELSKLMYTANEKDETEANIGKNQVKAGQTWRIGDNKIFVGKRVSQDEIMKTLARKSGLTLFLPAKVAQDIVSSFETFGAPVSQEEDF